MTNKRIKKGRKMKEIWDILLDAFIDTAKILPFLFIVYYLIELFEYKFAKKIQNNRLLKGNLSPVFGSLVGCVPQCGFSVVSADLFTKRVISVGALIAVFIATSDEALPLMISSPKNIKWLLLLLGIKILFAIVVGFAAMGLYKLIFKKQKAYVNMHNHADEGTHDENAQENEHKKHSQNANADKNVVQESAEINEHNEIELAHGGCCHHHVETKSFDWLHPLLHCLKIALFVLVINIIFGLIIGFVGHANLAKFLNKSIYVQPLLACIIGLIPNCASSVVLTELFLLNGGISFGALLTGLCVNAGLGIIILLKQNKNVKENIFIILMLIIPSLILGYALNFI